MMTLRFKSGLVFLLFLVSTVTLWAQSEKKKEIIKTFDVDSDTELVISNKYGDIHINSWEKNVIDVKVTVTAKKRSESRALEALEKVHIDISESIGRIEFETEISGNLSNRNGERITIDYVVNMPKSNNLYVKNAYGNLFIDDLDGDVYMRISYGNMKVGKLNGETEFKLSYGNGEIDLIKNGELSVGYSNLDEEEAGNIELTSHYSNVDIRISNDISLTSKYDNLKIGDVHTLKGNSKYGKVNINRLYSTLVLDLSYGSGVDVAWISRDFIWIDIDASYAGSSLYFEEGFGAELEGYFKYCDLKYPKNENFDFSYIDKQKSSSEYKGKIGSGTGKAKIRLRSKYANVRVGYSSLH